MKDGLSAGTFKDSVFRNLVTADLATGQHRNPTDNTAYITTDYFHRPDNLVDEIIEASFGIADSNYRRMLGIESRKLAKSG